MSPETNEQIRKTASANLHGTSDANISFDDLCQLLLRVWFSQRISGSHHVFRKAGITERINLQKEGDKAKCYQVRQVRDVLVTYDNGGQFIVAKYEMIIFWSEADQVFVVDVPELPGCMAHGNTPESALGNVQDAIRLWLDTAREFGDPIPQPKGRRLMFA